MFDCGEDFQDFSSSVHCPVATCIISEQLSNGFPLNKPVKICRCKIYTKYHRSLEILEAEWKEGF